MEDRRESKDLTSWKDIASYLKISVRTAQKWELERRLPVLRPPGKRAMVFARTQEIDDWLASGNAPVELAEEQTDEPGTTVETPKPDGQKAPSKKRFLAYLLLFLFVSVIVAVAIYYNSNRSQREHNSSTRSQPERWHVDGSTLVVLDIDRTELWRKDLGKDLLPGQFDQNTLRGHNQVLMRDIDGDGNTEVAVLVSHMRSNNALNGELVCFNSTGRKKWPSFRTQASLRSGRDSFSTNYNVVNIQFADFGGSIGRALVVVALNTPDYPCRVALLSPADGHVLREYWHSGHIGHWISDSSCLVVFDWDGDGRPEIFLAGSSNARRMATLVILDPETMAGASVEEDHDYQILGFPPGREKARILFPRACLTDQYGIALLPIVESGGLSITVQERRASANSMVIYLLDRLFFVREVNFSDGFRDLHALLKSQRTLDHTLDEAKEKEELKKIQVLMSR